ncbi:MAG: outer-membrane lipoprotein carrier protein LolA, partial [Rikenellaceae bacterium]
TTWAQNAPIESLFNRFKTAKSFKVEFSSEGENYTLISQGKLFNLTSNPVDVIFDGTDLYTFNKKSNEMLIERLSGYSILTNPINLFTLNLKDFNITKDKEIYILTPKLGTHLGIDRAEITMQNGSTIKSMDIVPSGMYPITFTLKTITYDITPSPNIFKFNKSSYPKVEIIDLR